VGDVQFSQASGSPLARNVLQQRGGPKGTDIRQGRREGPAIDAGKGKIKTPKMASKSRVKDRKKL